MEEKIVYYKLKEDMPLHEIYIDPTDNEINDWFFFKSDVSEDYGGYNCNYKEPSIGVYVPESFLKLDEPYIHGEKYIPAFVDFKPLVYTFDNSKDFSFNEGPIKSDGGSSSYYDLKLSEKTIDFIKENGYIKTEQLLSDIFDDDPESCSIFNFLIKAYKVSKDIKHLSNIVNNLQSEV